MESKDCKFVKQNEYSKFAIKKWYIIDSEIRSNYSHENPIKFLTKSIESNFCDCSDAYVLVTVTIAVVGANKKIVHHSENVEQK